MELTEFNSAKTLQATISQATDVQTKNATTGAKAIVMVVDQKGGKVLVHSSTLEELLGAAYTTLCATAMTNLNTAIATAKSDAETEFGLIEAA